MLGQSRVLDHDLGHAAGIAQDEKADLAQPAQAVQPAREVDALVHMLPDLGCPDTFHGDTPETQNAPSPCGRGGPWCHRISRRSLRNAALKAR